MSFLQATSGCAIQFKDHGHYYSATAKGIDVRNGMTAVLGTSVEELLEKLKRVMLSPTPDMVWESIQEQLFKEGYQ
ncbi:hypothetical protein J8628_03170 [Serratia fonticola]|uniref:hypothetical protein n=1 Tax=Serratia fonticola TaxID=47917 RepID=UPI001AEB2C3C|nr:hypothetical protein [Serratia fonticola]MBP1015908.1 hypothetical protein [Serratia fonticola]